jgi:hypothetical protein
LVDTTGANCAVGQQGDVWFLAGTFAAPSATRTCSIPAGKTLFFPLINQVNFNTPKECFQGPAALNVHDMRAGAASLVGGGQNISVELDGHPVTSFQRLQSNVFKVTLPADNIFNPFCTDNPPREGADGLPAGTYKPAIDDGIYVTLSPLRPGQHTLHFHAENPSAGVLVDVTYTLHIAGP